MRGKRLIDMDEAHGVGLGQYYAKHGPTDRFALRYGAVKARLEDVQESIQRWASGELDTLCEMDKDLLSPQRRWGSTDFRLMVTPMARL